MPITDIPPATITRGHRLYRAMAAAAIRLSVVQRMRLLTALQRNESFGTLPTDLQNLFELVADGAGVPKL